MDRAMTTERRDKDHLGFWYFVRLILEVWVMLFCWIYIIHDYYANGSQSLVWFGSRHFCQQPNDRGSLHRHWGNHTVVPDSTTVCKLMKSATRQNGTMLFSAALTDVMMLFRDHVSSVVNHWWNNPWQPMNVFKAAKTKTAIPFYLISELDKLMQSKMLTFLWDYNVN